MLTSASAPANAVPGVLIPTGLSTDHASIVEYPAETAVFAAAIEKEKLASRLLLQIHDELIVEVVKGEEEQITALVKREMGAAYPLKAPLDVSAGLGLTWHEAAH